MLDITTVHQLGYNQFFLDACVTNGVQVQQGIDFVESKLRTVVDQGQFLDDTQTYVYPDDLEQAAARLVQSYRIHLIQPDSAIKSEKIDDYAVTYADHYDTSRSLSSWFGIPILEEYREIIASYAGTSGEKIGSFSVTLS